MQRRREPNVGPGPAQIWRISGFVNSKTDGENAAFCPNYDVISEKIRSSPKFWRFFPVAIWWSQKKWTGLQASRADFSSVISMGPSRAHRPSAGPTEANGLPEAHGPPKVYGPRGHCTPLPSPLGGPGSMAALSLHRWFQVGPGVTRA